MILQQKLVPRLYVETPVPLLEVQDSYLVRPVASSDPLVQIPDELLVFNVYSSVEQFAALPQRRELMLRKTVVELLLRAQSILPSGYSLTILDGYRSPRFQQQLLEHYIGRFSDLERYVANPANKEWLAPHTTGGAVDLTLSYQQIPLALGSDFDEMTMVSHLDYFERHSTDQQALHLRRLLYKTLTKVGLAPLPQEWWHWSYGDQAWAEFYGLPAALYNVVELAEVIKN